MPTKSQTKRAHPHPWTVVERAATPGQTLLFRGKSLDDVYRWMRGRYTTGEEMRHGIAILHRGSDRWLGRRPHEPVGA